MRRRAERAELKDRLDAMAAERMDIPVVIGGARSAQDRTGRNPTSHNPPPGDRRGARGAPRVGELAAGRIARRCSCAPRSC